MPGKTVDQLLDEARARIERLGPVDAYEAMQAGARLIDIRSESQLVRDGIIPGALIIPRNVCEWRLDPSGAYRHPFAPGSRESTVVVCDEGFQSSLVAATLMDLGFSRAADLLGGFQAWLAADLPVAPCEEERLADVAEMEAYITGVGQRV